jgi:hypothetical protein
VTGAWRPGFDAGRHRVTGGQRRLAREPHTRIDQVLPPPYEADVRIWLARLRAEFPRWGFLFDPWRSTWVAVRGRHQIAVAATAVALRDALAGRRP